MGAHACACMCARVHACALVCVRVSGSPAPFASMRRGSQVSCLESLDCAEPRPQQHRCYGREASLVDSGKSLGMFSTQRTPNGP